MLPSFGINKVRAAIVAVAAIAGLAAMLAGGGGVQGQGRAQGKDKTDKTVAFVRNGAPAAVALTRSEHAGAAAAALELIVKPVLVFRGDDLMLRIDVVDSAQFESRGAGATRLASGTVSFFPPATPGDERRFVVPVDLAKVDAEAGQRLTAVVSLLPGHPDRTLGTTSIEVVSARLR